MSERIVNDPSLHGWVETDDGKWVWEASGGGLWEQNGDDIYYDAGNVGIGTDEISGLSGKPTVHINDKAGNGAIRVGNVTGSGGNVFIDHSDASGARLRANESPLSIGTNGSEDIRFHTDGEAKTRLTIDSTGRVGIGTDSPFGNLTVKGGSRQLDISTDGAGSVIESINRSDIETPSNISYYARRGEHRFFTYPNNSYEQSLTIDSSGNVGIGMAPLRSTAKEQLAEWKSQFDARLKDDPKADKKAVTLEITDDAFEVLPTEDKLAEWMETRAAGDKLQVNGNAHFSGAINATRADLVGASNSTVLLKIAGGSVETKMSPNGRLWREGIGGIQLAGTAVRCLGGTGVEENGVLDIGRSTYRFNNAFFSGTVDAAGFTVNGQPISGGGHSGNNLVIENPSAAENEKKWRFNVNDGNGRFRLQPLNDDDSPQSADYIQFFRNNTIETVATITAPDFIATSDERAKDNITTAPVGLIDSLKGREWEWKESGEKGSGVVAQELEQVLPHLVHEDDEGMKSVSYMGLCAYLIEELKDCRERLAVLEAKE